MVSKRILIFTVCIIVSFFLFTCQLFEISSTSTSKKQEVSQVSVFEGISLSYGNMSSVIGSLDSQIQDVFPVWGSLSEEMDVVYDILPRDEIVAIDHDSGVIRIIDTTASFAPTSYVVTATISAPYQTEISAEVYVSVLDQSIDISNKLSYTNVSDRSNKDIVVLPQWDTPLDKPSVTYSIDKELPAGMVFYETTGEIHISKEVLITDDTYTITATGIGAYYSTGVSSVSINLTAVIEGYVNEGRGDAGLSNVPVIFLNEHKVEIDRINTNSDGYFRFDNISALGIYGLKVVDTTGERASSFVSIDMSNFDDVPLLSIQHKRINSTTRTTDAPTLFLGGISSTPVQRGALVQVAAVAGGNDNLFAAGGSRYNLSISAGVVGSSNYEQVVYSGTELGYLIDTSDILGNATFVEVICYDNNNNQAIVLKPILVASEDSYQVVHSYNEGPAPGASSSSLVRVTALTFGRSLNLYGISPDTSIQVSINVKYHNQYNGIMLYKKILGDANEIEYVGYSSRITDTDGIQMFSFTDSIPSTSDGVAYVYQFRYYYYDSNTIRTYLGEKGPEIVVPIMPSYELEQQSPADYLVYDEVPSSITFEWQVSYDKNLFTQMSDNASGMAVGTFSRKDKLFLYEVGYSFIYANKSISINDVANVPNDSPSTWEWDTSTSSHALGGNFYEWAVTSDLSYDHTGPSNAYQVSSKSYSTYIQSASGSGYASNGDFYFTIK